MSRPKISVIIPVYNPGKHFERCLDSLVNQTLKEIEIIIILDCPTDGSDRVAERFAAADSRINVLHNTEKLHIGFSRNRGLAIAQGEYIGFHDSDDYAEPQMYQQLYEQAEHHRADIARCNFYCVYTQQAGGNIEQYRYPEASSAVGARDWLYEYVSGDKVSCVLWNHIFSADLLKKNNITFLDTRTLCSEDSIFFLEAYHAASELAVADGYLYHHIFHTTNTGKAYSYRSIGNNIRYFEALYRFMEANGVDEDKRLAYLSRNVARSLYSSARKALIAFPLKKALAEIGQIGGSDVVLKCVAFLYRKANRKERKSLKPTIRIFLRLIKAKF